MVMPSFCEQSEAKAGSPCDEGLLLVHTCSVNRKRSVQSNTELLGNYL